MPTEWTLSPEQQLFCTAVPLPVHKATC